MIYFKKGSLGFIAALVLTIPAWADTPTGIHREVSCQWSEPPSAKAALALLKVGDIVQLYCKTCGDRTSTPVTITRSEVVATVVATMKQVNLNGGMLDQAQAYVRTQPNGPWRNLSKLTKCDTPTSNPDTLPVSVVSKAPPGAFPDWWKYVQQDLESLK